MCTVQQGLLTRLGWQENQLFFYLMVVMYYTLKTITPQNPEGLFTIKATGTHAGDKLALYEAAGIKEPVTAKWISHHVSYNPATNEMTMQLVNPNYHSHPHVGGVHDFEKQTGLKYNTDESISAANKLNCKGK